MTISLLSVMSMLNEKKPKPGIFGIRNGGNGNSLLAYAIIAGENIILLI